MTVTLTFKDTIEHIMFGNAIDYEQLDEKYLEKFIQNQIPAHWKWLDDPNESFRPNARPSRQLLR